MTTMRLPELPKGLFWDLQDDKTNDRPYRWRIVWRDGSEFSRGTWRDNPFSPAAKWELRLGAIMARHQLASDDRWRQRREAVRVVSTNLIQQRTPWKEIR